MSFWVPTRPSDSICSAFSVAGYCNDILASMKYAKKPRDTAIDSQPSDIVVIAVCTSQGTPHLDELRVNKFNKPPATISTIRSIYRKLLMYEIFCFRLISNHIAYVHSLFIKRLRKKVLLHLRAPNGALLAWK